MKYKSTAGMSIQNLNDIIAERFYEVAIEDDACGACEKVYNIYAMLSAKRAIEKFLMDCPKREQKNPNTEKIIFSYIYLKLAYLSQHAPLAAEEKLMKKENKIYNDKFFDDLNGLETIMKSNEGKYLGLDELLRNLLAEKGIESKLVYGLIKDETTGEMVRRDWMQVKLDGEWFNCDIVNDASFIAKNLIAPTFLKSNKDYLNQISQVSEFSPNIEEDANKSITDETQEALFRVYRVDVLREMFLKDDGKKKKQSWFKKLSSLVESIAKPQRGEEE